MREHRGELRTIGEPAEAPSFDNTAVGGCPRGAFRQGILATRVPGENLLSVRRALAPAMT